MVKAEAKTVLKRKGMANQSPAKKQKLETTSPKKAVAPQKQNNQQSNKKLNKKNNKNTPDSDSPKKVTKFAGTAQLKLNKKQNKPKNGTAKPSEAEGQKKKRHRLFGTLITETKTKAGTKDADLLKVLNEKITAIQSKPEISKTAKKKLTLLQKLKIVVEEGNSEKPNANKKDSKVVKAKQATAKAAAPTKKTQKVEDESEDEEENDSEEDASADEDGDEQEGVDSDEEDEIDGEEDDDSDEDQELLEEEEDDDEDEDDESDEAPPPVQGDISQKSNKELQGKNNINLNDLKKSKLVHTGQKRYVLFVGNIPYDTTKQDLLTHFNKVGDILHIRIPTDKKTNKPRGFGYVEVKDEVTYQKCLSMHHTHLKNRRINVLYTQGGKKKGAEKKTEIKVKNMKLHALRKQGKLAGSVKQSQKRSFRRNKQKQNEVEC